MKGIEFVDRAQIPSRSGKLRLMLFPQFEELVKVPGKVLCIDMQAIQASRQKMYNVVRQWNKKKPVKLQYTSKNVRTDPIIYIYA